MTSRPSLEHCTKSIDVATPRCYQFCTDWPALVVSNITQLLQGNYIGLPACAAYGVVRNPYSLDRSTAGSSGGPAAGASANYAMISMGTDTGNSIRGPSGHQGLVGLRSSIGQTSRSAANIPLFSSQPWWTATPSCVACPIL